MDGREFFQSLINACYEKEWTHYIKESFKNAEKVIGYLGRYTHRIAISNHRILGVDGEDVIFRDA